MTDSYITVLRQSREEIIINKSRFIAEAIPCASEPDALAFLRRIKENSRDATHHCYAYIIGENSGIMRYSDDGEPGGTAGLPIMETMRTKGIVNCCIVVTRYFGGVLLGTGGLVRAYTKSSQSAIEAAGIAKMELTSDNLCELPYSLWDKFRYAAEQLPVRIDEIEYGSEIVFHLLIRSRERENMLTRLEEASGGKLVTIPVSESYSAWLL